MRCRKSKSSGCASFCASVTLSAKASQEMTVSMATNGSRPACLASDGLAGCLELLLMLVLSGVEQLAEDAVVQVDDVVGDGGHAFDGERYQGCVAALRLELGQVGGRHRAAFASDLEQPVLMHQPLDAGWQIKHLPGLEAFDVFQHVPRIRLGR